MGGGEEACRTDSRKWAWSTFSKTTPTFGSRLSYMIRGKELISFPDRMDFWNEPNLYLSSHERGPKSGVPTGLVEK